MMPNVMSPAGLVILALLCSWARAGYLQQPLLFKPDPALQPSVTLRNGTVYGQTVKGIDTFLGIPFAQPPVGNLRLRKPQPLVTKYGTFNATAQPVACPQQASFSLADSVPAYQAALAQNPELAYVFATDGAAFTTVLTGEDCLTLNVQRVTGTQSSSRLPVLVFIEGGGYEGGSTQGYDATPILSKSASLGHEVVFVAMNYRQSAFGFLPGRQLQHEGNTNLGLHDQRMALRWVHENIEAFGGDPDKVTIWGQSAGAVSVFDQFVVNDGDSEGLFRAGIMDSGMAFETGSVDSANAQLIFDQVVDYCGCNKASDKVDCLRSVPYELFHNASNAQPSYFSYQSLDISYVRRPDPQSNFLSRSSYSSLRHGLFAKLPIISGNQQDEGTLFVLNQAAATLKTTAQLVEYLTSRWSYASRKQVRKFVSTYPDDPSAGSPFDTGDSNQLYPQSKRLAAISGDTTFTFGRRLAFDFMARHVPALYGYIATYFHGLPILGTLHGSDMLVIYDKLRRDVNGTETGPIRDAILTYYISFLHYLDPNKLLEQEIITAAAYHSHGHGHGQNYARAMWPKWEKSSRKLLEFGREEASVSATADESREKSYSFFRRNVEDLAVG